MEDSTPTTPDAPAVPQEPVARRHEGRVALVTGAARGQGRAIAVRLAAEGADVIAVDNCTELGFTTYAASTAADLDETVRLVEESGAKAFRAQVDVRDHDGLANAVSEGVSRLGRLDVVVANAGATASARAWEITPEAWEESIAVNLTGAFHTARVSIPTLIEQGSGGAIVFISSTAGMVGLPLMADYVAAKHGVTGLSKALANELGEHRIRVNSVHPFGVVTGLVVAELHPQLAERPHLGAMFQGSLPDRMSEAGDIAAAVAWIASDEARHVNGIQLPVDMGRSNR